MSATPSGEPLANPLEVAPMRRGQFAILAAAMLLAALDGYDILSMAFVAPALSEQWHIGKPTIGLLLSSGLAGMAIGSLLLAPMADRLGRRPLVLFGLLLMTAGALLSALAGSVALLAAARALTGVGIGTMVAMTTLLAAEFADARRGAAAVAAVATIGTPVGGIAGAVASAALLRFSTWPYVFLLGAALGAGLFVLFLVGLPETPTFLLARQPPGALVRLNRVLTRLGHSRLTRLPPPADRARSAYRAVFAPDLAGTTARLVAVNVLIALAIYYVTQWLPQLVADAGFPLATASLVATVPGIAGIVGGIAISTLAFRVAPAGLASACAAGLAVALVAIGLAPTRVGALVAAAALFGVFLAGATGSTYAILARAFPPSLRASGVGVAIGSGRVAAIFGPALAGWMFGSGLQRAGVSLLFAVAPAVAALIVLGVRLPRR